MTNRDELSISLAPRGNALLSPWSFIFRSTYSLTVTLLLCGSAVAGDADGVWQRVFTVPPNASWISGSNAELDAANQKKLSVTPGNGVLVSTKSGSKKSRNLQTTEVFGDHEVRLEFMLAKGSNAGVKLHGLYEVQLFDSYGVVKPDATHAGGIYPRAVRKPSYHHIDKGSPPLVNAAKPAGQWQSFSVRFRAPRFNDAGIKIRSAVFEEVQLNGKIVQRAVTIDFPTGAYWHLPETPSGPLYLQGDHGPVAYRNVQVRPLGVTP